MIDNSLPPMGKFYSEAKANEMVAEERAKWLKALEDIKAEVENMAFYKCDSVRLLPKDYVLEIIDRKVNEVKGDKGEE